MVTRLPERAHDTDLWQGGWLAFLAAVSLVAALLTAAQPSVAASDEPLVAVAANFADVARVLGQQFTERTGVRPRLVVGSTGKLFAQIVHGAPFELLLAADQERPQRLEALGFTVAGSRFTYAQGQLVLWAPGRALQTLDPPAVAALLGGDGVRVVMANPRLAPYGRAARETLEHMNLWTPLAGRVAMGENVGQAYALIATGNATLGFVGRAQVNGSARPQGWVVPGDWYQPIRQDAVLTRQAGPGARAFSAFLRSETAAKVIRSAGYAVPPADPAEPAPQPAAGGTRR